MRESFPRTNYTGYPFLWIILCLLMLAVVGCSKSAAPLPVPVPVVTQPVTVAGTSMLIGGRFPEIQTYDLDGNAVLIDRRLFGDRCTLVVFWSTWCGICMAELPHEVELARRYEKDGFRVIGVNADKTSAVAKSAATEYQLPWLNVFEGPEKYISGQLGIEFWPALFLLDSDGKVIAAMQQLRQHTVRTMPDGSVQPISSLDLKLEELLGTK